MLSACGNCGSQEVDIVSIVKPLTKYAVTIDDPQSIRYHLEKAVHLARSGRPGPVWIDIPIDVQAMPVEPDSMRGFDPTELSKSDRDDLEAEVRDVIARPEPGRAADHFCGQRSSRFRCGGTFQNLCVC